MPLIDAGVLRNIAALAKPTLLNSMIDLYLQHSPGLVEAIETAAAKMQSAALSQAVHTLKSSTANLGGTRLATVAKECELLWREGGITQAAPIVARIRKEHQEFCAALTDKRSSTPRKRHTEPLKETMNTSENKAAAPATVLVVDDDPGARCWSGRHSKWRAFASSRPPTARPR